MESRYPDQLAGDYYLMVLGVFMPPPLFLSGPPASITVSGCALNSRRFTLFHAGAAGRSHYKRVEGPFGIARSKACPNVESGFTIDR